MQESLTGREHEVLNMLLEGAVPKEIALSLNISNETVLTHKKTLYRKLEVHSINELLGKYLPDNPIVKKSTESIFKSKNPDLVHGVNYNWIKLDFIRGVYHNWIKFSDNLSSADFSIGEETDEGQTFAAYTFSGNQNEKNGSYAGVYGFPDYDTLNAMKSMSSFSFRVLGDGNEYMARLPTSDTVEGDHHFKTFSTEKDAISTITIKIDEDLVQWGWSGHPCEFIQENIMYLQFEPAHAGQFNLKFWDIRLYP